MRGTTITFLGTGDAFGSGGRLQCSIHIDTGCSRFLMDCGATALLALKRHKLSMHDIETILVSHLHGDHTCGIPFILRETQIASLRSGTLTIAGPPGIEAHVRTLMKTLFPGSWSQGLTFDLVFTELTPLRTHTMGGLTVTPYPAVHSPLTNPLSLRVEAEGAVIAYSGDTEWNDHLITAARDADLFICECFAYDGPRKNHMDYQTLLANRHLLSARTTVLTHMDDSLLGRASGLAFPCAHDGMILAI